MGERAQYRFEFTAKADDGWRAGLLPMKAHDLILPVNVLGGEVGDVGLSAT